MLTDRVAPLIKMTMLVVEKMTNGMLAPYELTSTQFRILMFLRYRQDVPTRQKDIENAFALTNPTVTGILHNLEKKGLVKRCENPADRRSKLIALTDQAVKLLPELDAVGERIDAQVTGSLSETEREQLAALLKRILMDNGGGSFGSQR